MKLHNHSTIHLKIHGLIRDNLWRTNHRHHTAFVIPIIPLSSTPIFINHLEIKSFQCFPNFPFFPSFHDFHDFPPIPKNHRRKPAL